jgi:hypothetical protein
MNSEIRYCTSCGEKVLLSAKFCAKCGCQVEIAVAPVVTPAVFTASVALPEINETISAPAGASFPKGVQGKVLSLTGTVCGVNKWAETNVSGGGSRNFGGYISIDDVRSTTKTNLEFFIKNETGEHPVDRIFSGQIRDGQVVSIYTLTANSASLPLFLTNFSTNIQHALKSGEQIASIMAYAPDCGYVKPSSTGLRIAGGLICLLMAFIYFFGPPSKAAGYQILAFAFLAGGIYLLRSVKLLYSRWKASAKNIGDTLLLNAKTVADKHAAMVRKII